MKEKNVLQLARLTLAKQGFTLFRNNLGQYRNDEGHVIRYGLCSPGGSDLIGYKTLVITHSLVGTKIAQFVAREVKGTGGRLSEAQQNFLSRVIIAGGDAAIITPEDLR